MKTWAYTNRVGQNAIVCVCETTIGEHIPVKDLCLLVRDYAGVVDGEWITNWMNEHGQSIGTKFAFRYLYDARTNQLTYSTSLHRGTIALCTPNMVSQYMLHLASLPYPIMKSYARVAADEMIQLANEIGKKLETEAMVRCEH